MFNPQYIDDEIDLAKIFAYNHSFSFGKNGATNEDKFNHIHHIVQMSSH